MGRKTKATIFTLVLSITNSISMTLFNLIYNNYLIRSYGSQVNGLISTLTQFVSLFTLIEGGFTTATVVATYNPIVKKDYERLNDILYTAKKTFYKIGLLITLGVLIIGSIYILFIESPFSYIQTYSLLIISVLTTAFSLCFLSRYSILLQGYNKEYIQVGFALVSKTVTWIISMLMIVNNVSVILVYCINIVNILINVLLIYIYEKKYYPHVTYDGKYEKEGIKGTGDVLFQKIANTIFTSTDLVLISTCISLAAASVYNVYYQIFRAVYTLLASVVQAPFNSFGQLFHSENESEKFEYYFNIYQHLVLVISTIFLTITGVMIIPFVSIYTAKITDYNYIYPSLALLFFSQIFAQIVNRPYGTILNATGNFKMQNKQCLIAAIVNLICSIAFIDYWGINSIILGSFVGTLVILVINIWQVYKHIFGKRWIRNISNIIINYLVGLCFILISLKIEFESGNYMQWIWNALICTIISSVGILFVNFIIDYKDTRDIVQYTISVVRRKTNKDNAGIDFKRIKK